MSEQTRAQVRKKGKNNKSHQCTLDWTVSKWVLHVLLKCPQTNKRMSNRRSSGSDTKLFFKNKDIVNIDIKRLFLMLHPSVCPKKESS